MRAPGPIRTIVLSALLALTACSALPPRPAMRDAWAPPPATEGAIAERLAPAEARHPGESGFHLVANGTEAECVVSRGADISVGHSGTVARLVVAPECGRVLPGMDKAAFWMDREDGTVAFSADGRHDIVSFAVADGDGYESFRPRLPLIALKPR